MVPFDLNKELEYVNHSRENRKRYAKMVIENPGLLPEVLDILFDVDNKKSCRAAWLIEFVSREDLNVILPHLDRFTSEMQRVYMDSAVRPVARVCERLIKAYYGREDHRAKEFLKPLHKERIIELSFDYLIGKQKVAPKAYSITSLYLLGTEYDWIHPELRLILEKDYGKGSPGYKARSRRVLDKLKKKA